MELQVAHRVISSLQTDLPVLLLHNLDHAWSDYEFDTCREYADRMDAEMRAAGHPLIRATLEDQNLTNLLCTFDPSKLIVFNWCEEIPGVPRSGWMVAKELEQLGFTYTGSDLPALILSQDKRLVKKRLEEAGVPTPPWKIYDAIENVDWDLYPAIVKPAFEHFSMGIDRESVVLTEAELIQRIYYVLKKHQQPALVEEFINGPEIHVGVIGNEILQMLPPAEIDFSAFTDIHDRLCTYETNFIADSISYQSVAVKLPIDLTPKQISCMEKAVLAAYRVTDCRDYARIDLRIRNGAIYILDVNHNADISPDTSLIRGAAMAGYSYGEFGSLLINLAAKRHPRFGNGTH